MDPSAGKVTFKEFATQWLASQTADPSTIVNMELRFRLHAFPYIGSRSLSAFQPAPIRTWTRALADSGIAASYQRTVFANVSTVFGAAVDDGEIFGLAVDEVDFIGGVVHVVRQVKLVGPHMVFAPPKGGKLRDVPLPNVVSEALAAHITRRPPIDVTLPWKTRTARPQRRNCCSTQGSARR
ncbi:hypothetical protein [Streptomyces sp. NPDC014006]|uniref:hypothetical protein n=1 Tax=Streptomyces sp. NPDC014006 TaxID=3364870 RepID=UPI003701EB0C